MRKYQGFQIYDFSQIKLQSFVANFQLSFKQLLKIDTFINGSKQKEIFFAMSGRLKLCKVGIINQWYTCY